MDPMLSLTHQHVTGRHLDQRALQHRLELRFAWREERRCRRQRRRQQLAALLRSWRPSKAPRRPIAICVSPTADIRSYS